MGTNTANRLATADRGDAAGPDPAPGAASAVIDASVLTAQLAFLAPGNSARFPWSRFPWGGPGDGRTVLASTSSTGEQSDGDSYHPAVSANGRFVVFESYAANLVPGDANGTTDVFVKDLRTGKLTLASADAAGNPANGLSGSPSISADGRFVAFESSASNLVPGDTNESYDAFVKDLRTGSVTLASADADGTESNGPNFGPSFSNNGRFVAFVSYADNLAPNDANEAADVFVKDLRTCRLTLASADADGTGGNNLSRDPSLSADGRLVAFASFATNLLPGGTEGEQIFVKDLRTGRVTLASADAGGQAGDGRSVDAAISPNGRYVSFSSEASNLVPGDSNNTEDVFRKDLWTGGIDRLTNNDPAEDPYGPGTEQSSVANTGAVAFSSAAGNLLPRGTNGLPGDINFMQDIFFST